MPVTCRKPGSNARTDGPKPHADTGAEKGGHGLEHVRVALVHENSRIMATTRAKMEADSATACPTSMFLNISPERLRVSGYGQIGLSRGIAFTDGSADRTEPHGEPPPVYAATLTQV
jgi:hypothetical protein